ncbi:phage minor head protein [Zavarzinella formosa]|uniref:phage minor head protein n=1 Tax=Zavarzinella formosa TaxID=360055 RepID=UPI0003755A5A|nr:phage minor head protein [Zavarzinella formosa]
MNKRTHLRVWIALLDRYELLLRVNAGKARNAFLSHAAYAYPTAQSLPTYVIEAHRKRIETVLTAHYQKVIPHFAGMALSQIKSRRIEKKSDTFQRLMAEWVSREALRKAAMIAATDAEAVRSAIRDGLDEGDGTEEIGRRIRKVSQLTKDRAGLIARTETHAAATFGSIESVRVAEQDLGVRMLKQWLPTLDNRTRPAHAAMSGQPPIPLDEKFIVDGEMMDRPGDPSASPANLLNCRCALIYTEATD